MVRKAEFAGLIFWFTTLTVAVTAQVSLPAVVVDGSGQALHGLQKPDFDVRCGKAASFDSVEEVSPLKFSNFSNPVPVFILLDTISIPKPRQNEVEQFLLSYLRKAADDHLAVTVLATTTTGVRVIHDMSTDSKVFAAALDRIHPKAGQGSPPPPASPDAFAKAVNDEVAQLQLLTQPMANLPTDDYLKLMSLQLQSLTMVGKMLQRSPMRKPLVWISGSFPAHRDKDEHKLVINYTLINQSPLPEGRLEAAGSLEPSFEAAIDSLNNARLSLYPVWIQGPIVYSRPSNFETTSPLTATGAAIAAQSSNGKQYTSGAGLADLARATGGSVLTPDKTDFASSVSDLQQHFDSYYLLKFTLQPTRKTTWIDSSVKVSKPDIKVTAVNGFFSQGQ